MAFHEVRLPDDVEKGAEGGPQFNTTVLALASGFEQRNINWSQTRGKWNISYGIQTKSLFDVVLNFFYAREGQAHGFRFKDWSDFELARQNIGTTDGSTATYQVFKRYSSGGIDFDRTLKKLVSGSVMVWVNNVAISQGAGAGQFLVDTLTGIISLGSTLAAQSGTDVETQCEFDVPVRFDTDQFTIRSETFDAGSIPRLPILELRL